MFKKYFIAVLLLILSMVSLVIYFPSGKNLNYADSISRLDIARKVVDNITPGLPQIGNVWLPLPQLLMLPFIWNNYLWHSGLAGAIMSSIAFIIGGLYIFKSAKVISNSFIGSLIALGIYALNINILYLQTTAMSEALFVCTLSAVIYYFLVFFKTNNKYMLIPAALAVCAITLTRYEGLAILFLSIPVMFVYIFLKTKKIAKAESLTILYSSLACLGFACWTLYLTAIFGDPLYWKHYYVSSSAVSETGAASYSQAKPLIDAIWEYFTSCTWMIGLIPVLFSILAMIIMIVKDFKNKTVYFIPLLLPLSIFIFMVLTLQRNTPIVQPELSLANFLSSETSKQTGFNIRYGLLLLPWAAIMVSFLFAFKKRYINITMMVIFILFFSVQIYSSFIPSYSVIYQIQRGVVAKPYGDFVKWMKLHYDGGKILISAGGHEDQMFMMGFDYKTYIHEGTNKYWKESLDDPPRYATWVILDKGQERDPVAGKRNIDNILARDYTLVFQEDQVEIFKINHPTYFKIED